MSSKQIIQSHVSQVENGFQTKCQNKYIAEESVQKPIWFRILANQLINNPE